jgi:hypothetical protein
MTDDSKRVEMLENILAQMLQPVRGIPFSVVVKALSKHAIIKIDPKNADDNTLIQTLVSAAKIAGKATQATPIVRPRPNEVGNDVEAYVMRGLQEAKLRCQRPQTARGSGKATGYPDILLFDGKNRPTYLECKIYGAGTVGTSMRSFYLSPSDDFKVSQEARHVLLAFEMQATAVPGSRNSEYRATAFKLVDLHDLQCDVKYEFNSDNRRLYADGLLLAADRI